MTAVKEQVWKKRPQKQERWFTFEMFFYLMAVYVTVSLAHFKCSSWLQKLRHHSYLPFDPSALRSMLF